MSRIYTVQYRIRYTEYAVLLLAGLHSTCIYMYLTDTRQSPDNNDKQQQQQYDKVYS